MKKQTILENIQYLDESQLGYQHITDLTTGFHYQELSTNSYEQCRVLEQNAILFIIEGSCSFSYDQYLNKVFFAGDMLFFPKSAMVTGVVLERAKFLYMTFDVPLDTFDKQYFQQLWDRAQGMEYEFKPLKINYPIGVFINSMVYLMENGGNATNLHEIKHKELFLILRLFYSKEQFAEFFYPIIGQSFNFRNFVLETYGSCRKLSELIERSNITTNVFMRKFKQEFGMSAYQWMLKQMCQKIQHKASQPEVTVKEIMFEMGFVSPTHFNRICKKYFDKTPKQLITFCQNTLQKK